VWLVSKRKKKKIRKPKNKAVSGPVREKGATGRERQRGREHGELEKISKQGKKPWALRRRRG